MIVRATASGPSGGFVLVSDPAGTVVDRVFSAIEPRAVAGVEILADRPMPEGLAEVVARPPIVARLTLRDGD